MTVTKDDFEKVWASTSPLTPYAFSDAKYKEGWNFVGSTPPSRQMWDYLQKNNDEKMQYLLNHFDNYLPLSGGTMTGGIYYNGTNNERFYFGSYGNGVSIGWDWESRTGAGIGLYNTSRSTDGGTWVLWARTSSNSCVLMGKPTGDLTWDNKEIERVNSSGSNYIRYESGIQICWGYADTPPNGVFTVTFPVAFINTNYCMNVTGLPASTGTASSRITSLSTASGDKTTTSWKGTIVNASNVLQGTGVVYIAIGKWK